MRLCGRYRSTTRAGKNTKIDIIHPLDILYR
jgi:hypothetical protein